MKAKLKNAADKLILQKTSGVCSIILERIFGENDNDVFDAFLLYVSELPHIKILKRTNNGVYMFEGKHVLQLTPDTTAKCVEILFGPDKSPTSMTIEYSTTTQNIAFLRDSLEKMQSDYCSHQANKLGRQAYYFDEMPLALPKDFDGQPDLSRAPQNIMFKMYPLFTNKKLSNVYGDVVDEVVTRVNFFLNNKTWYEVHGVPYTLGLLLYGKSGCGKTSCIKALANDTKRHVINIKLSESTTISQFTNLFYSNRLSVVKDGVMTNYDIATDNRIIVIEDIDVLTVAQSRENNEGNAAGNDSTRLNLSVLLNILDGILEQPGRIVIMTTNCPERIDRALIRPGRVDVMCEFKKCTASELVHIVMKLCDIEDVSVYQKYTQLIQDKKYTPAEVTQKTFAFSNNARATLEYFSADPEDSHKVVETDDEVPKLVHSRKHVMSELDMYYELPGISPTFF